MWMRKLLFISLFTITVIGYINGEENKCFVGTKKPERKELIDNQRNVIRVKFEMTKSVGQRIYSQIIKILLNEALGYNDIYMEDVRSQFDTALILDRIEKNTVMINMEVWIPSGHPSLHRLHQSKELRVFLMKLTPFIGSFVPLKFSCCTHWTDYTDSKIASKYPMNLTTVSIIENLSEREFIPGRCRNNNCTIMVVGDSLFQDAIKLIEGMNLYMKVYSVERHLEKVTSLLLESNFFVLYHWYPSEFTSSRKQFAHITNSTNVFSGEHVFSLYKITSSRLGCHAPSIAELVKKADLPSHDYINLIESFKNRSSDTNEYDIACAWIKKNTALASTWIPRRLNKFPIAVLLPKFSKTADEENFLNLFRVVADAINQENKEFLLLSSRCVITLVNAYPDLIGIVGLPSPHQPFSALVEELQLTKTVISYAVEELRYPYMLHTIGSSDPYGYIYAKFLVHLNWRRVAFIIADSPNTHSEDVFHDNGISIVSYSISLGKKEPRELDEVLMKLIGSKVKIIIYDGSIQSTRLIICAASRLNMTAKQGYVWFLAGWLPVDWWRVNRTDSLCTPDDLFKVINGHFSIEQVYFGPDDQQMQENMTIGQWRERHDELLWNNPFQKYAGFFYDACWAYVYAVLRLKEETSDVGGYIHRQCPQRFREIISKLDFYGLSGRVRFENDSYRVIDYRIKQFFNGIYRTVGNFDGNLTINHSAIFMLWNSDGEAPSSCLLESFAKAFNVCCAVAFIILFFMIALPLGFSSVISFMIFKRRFDRKVRKHEKLMASHKELQSDEWEIPRNNVVMNRRIGEGAFGKVYGGEALFPDSGWTPVAVKILKHGSSTEAISNFLSEIEVMKGFDHPNMVKLLGVCMKSDPTLTVMEFMLYGDLKTYLLARKHLVRSQGYEKSDEVGYQRLTRMALDVAGALSYLEQLKFVHRDIASRNCLISAERVVKLGDFGMTRSLYENDYYRLCSTGLVPVRWMAPESLSYGIYTLASDVWSFGVLLYEIITFGLTPYQGKSNEQVLDYVRSGETLSVPNGVESTLGNLMNSCWTMDQTKRPTITEIIAIFVANPSLLKPCSDLLSSSLEETLDFTSTEAEGPKMYVKWPNPLFIPDELVSKQSTPFFHPNHNL